MIPPVVIVLGNNTALHATEAAYRDGYAHAGCQVLGIGQDEAFQRGPSWFYDRAMDAGAALVQYSRTHNASALTPDWTALWRRLEDEGIKTVGAHLDVYWGLPEREGWIASGDPQFTVGTLFTADGGSDEKWAAAGVNHRWLPPACDTRFIPEHPEPIPELADKIVFVGSAYGYHPEHSLRGEMITFATMAWPDRFVIYGNGSANGAVRGEMLARIYASECVVIGDGCFAESRARYFSDRIPETLGRGGLLCVAATDEGLGGVYTPGVHLFTWEPGDFDHLGRLVKNLYRPEMARQMRKDAKEHTLASHTYRHRARTILDTVGVEVPE